MHTSDIERRVENAIAAALPRAARVACSKGGDTIEFNVNRIVFQAHWLGLGTTGDVGLLQVQELLSRGRHESFVVVGRRMTAEARQALADAGIGWIEETSRAEIAFDGLVVSRSGRSLRGGGLSPHWTRSLLGIAEALLCGVSPTVSATMEATGLSTGSCAQGLSFLERLGFLTSAAPRGRGARRILAEGDDLLAAYAAAAEALPSDSALAVEVPQGDLVQALSGAGRKWDRAHIAWAATGPVAAQALKFLPPPTSKGDVFVAADARPGLVAIASIAGLRPRLSGRLVLRLFPTVTTRRFAVEEHGMRFAPWPRLYADLCTRGSAAEAAAARLRAMEDPR